MRFRVANTDGQGANLRPSPGTTEPPIRSLPEGTELNGDEHAWRQVTDTSGAQGWVADEFLAVIDGHMRVAHTEGQGANLRREPDTSAERIKVLGEGSDVTSAEHAWRRVSSGADRGWLAVELLAPLDADVWSFETGLACSRENYWDPSGQPRRRAAMEEFNKLPFSRRKQIFEIALDAGLDAEGITEPATRDRWKLAMRTICLGDSGFPGECPDLNPFMLAGEVGGVFHGGADALNSSALGYFQFLAQKPIPVGSPFTPDFDFGHWKRFGPCPDDYAHQTDPVCQVREFVRAIQHSSKHHGDPMSVVEEKRTWPHVWGP
jgi:hypothetical protein